MRKINGNQQVEGGCREDHRQSSGDDEVVLSSHDKVPTHHAPLGQRLEMHRVLRTICGMNGCSRRSLLRGLARNALMKGDPQWGSSRQQI